MHCKIMELHAIAEFLSLHTLVFYWVPKMTALLFRFAPYDILYCIFTSVHQQRVRSSIKRKMILGNADE